LPYLDPLISRVAGARERLPALRFFTDIVGEIVLGSPGKRVPVVAGTMDAWSGLFGGGIRRAGQSVYISGTSEILAVTSARRIGAPGVVTFPKAAGLTVNAGPTQSGGDSLQWWGDVIGRDVAGVLALAAEADRHRRPILFLPHLEGERAPLWDAQLRGAFIGLDRRASGPDYALAVMEGVALSARMLLDACDAPAAEATPRLFHAGGGARSDLWAQIKADCLGRPLDRVACLDVGCLGTAIMAAVGIGAYPSLAEAISAMTHVERSFGPDPRMRARYDAMYDAYSRATRALRPLGIAL
jgi:xylulokinase